MLVQDVPAEVRPDPTVLYEEAVRDRRAGRSEAALAKLDTVLRIRPEDTDALLNRGLSLLALDRLDEAEADFQAVLVRAPHYVDARLGLALVARRRGDARRAIMETDKALLAAPERADLKALARALRPQPAWRFDLDGSRSRLGAGLSDWNEVRVAAAHAMDERSTITGVGEWTERFDKRDLFVEGRLDRLFPWGEAYGALGGAVEADYRPTVSVRVGAEVHLLPSINGTLDASAARFASGDVSSLQPGLVADLSQGRVRLAARWINVWDETDQHRAGYAVSVNWTPTDRLRFRADYADAPESSEGLTTDVRALSAGVEIGLTDQISLRVGGLEEDRGRYDRKAITLGLGWRFW